MAEDVDLETRTGLPDALTELVREHPRDLWQSHAAFDGLTRFWLDRHILFRRLLAQIQEETQAMLDRRVDPDRATRRVARSAQLVLSELHAHHRIEDSAYFPRLETLEPRLTRGFYILDHDHHALDGHLTRLAETTNRLIRAEPIARHARAGDLVGAVSGFERLLDRHLVDEEELVVPILLKHGQALGA
ncbi:Hemerythrin HHE cation binding domain-containing protein [Rhodovulum sp. ES.010]|uniref:hemerythrin domain-containing protein n=1 Tax=Rhodovulum sp. ES.010 TaxID=1882821 RepID=UPI00092C48FE|nr:hemerythrin domain-containing protein [Rhodovulum sp. ES.010]SIO31735.1 Hemerythrin HHE cation binding domain-containing protein [Rhodovulum sp. ES.010]